MFAHNRLAVYGENLKKGLQNDFDLNDIKGAAATILIAGNDTVSGRFVFLQLNNKAVD